MRLLALALALSAGPFGLAPRQNVSGTTIARGRPVADAVVWVDAPGAPLDRTPTGVLDQRNVQFAPRVLAVQAGTRVKFPNSDRVFHNVFSYHEGTKFDFGLYPVGTVKEVPFDTPGLSRVFCNIHPQMAAYVMVVDTPYFAVSNRRGQFTIADVPRGIHRYHAWRPGGTVLTAHVEIAGPDPVEIRWP